MIDLPGKVGHCRLTPVQPSSLKKGHDIMSRGYPSLTALLGILAVAGYQNRDKLAQMFGTNAAPGAGQPSTQLPIPSRLDESPVRNEGITKLLAGVSGAGALLSNGLAELVDRFQTSGQGPVADSWIKTGPNEKASPADLENAIGADVLETLTSQTGLTRAEIVARLTRDLPDAVDRYTPDGKIPTLVSQV